MTEPINTPPAESSTQGGPPVTPASGATPEPTTGSESAPSRLPAITALIAVLVLLADQGAKHLAVDRLTGRGRVDVLGDLFGFRLIRNSGAAFSIGTGATWVLTAIALVVVVVIVRISRRLGSRGWTLALGLVLGGALGNLSDRLFRAPSFFHGHVVDFLELPHWPIFNLADMSIDTGAVLIALLSLRGIGIDGRRLNEAPKTDTTEGSATPND
jgi:signal peptidase II